MVDVLKLLRQAYRAYRRQKNWQRIVRAMAMVVVFCTTYALILPAITMEQSPECGLAEHIHGDGCYGEVTLHTHTEDCYDYLAICGQEEVEEHSHTEDCNAVVDTLVCALEETEEHAHVATCYEYETKLTCGLEETEGHAHGDACYQKNLICGLEEGSPEGEALLICDQEVHTHTDACYNLTEPTEAPTEETTKQNEEQTYNFAGDGMQAQIELDAETDVPADAAVVLEALDEENAQYAELSTILEESVETDTLGMTLLDISFYDTEGEYISVPDPASVTLMLEGTLFTDTQAKIYHIVDGASIEIEHVEVSYCTVAAEEGTQKEYTQLTFRTDGFSVFAIVEAEKNITDRVAVTGVDPTQLAGTYYIACQHGTRDIYCSVYNKNSFNYVTGGYGSEWTFVQVADNTYKIHCGGQYMVMYSGTGDGYTSLTTDENAASVFTVSKRGDKYNLQVGSHYLNEFGGHDNMMGFRGYDVAGDGGNNLTLYPAKPKADNLDGKQFALVSYTHPKAMSNFPLQVNGVSGLGCNDVTLSTVDGVTYVKGDAILWTFEATGISDVYNIYTEDENGNPKYLNLLESYYDTTGTAKGSLTLSDTAQNITVTVNDDGTIYLSYRDGNGNTGYINLDQAVYNFWTYNGEGNASKLRLCVEQTVSDEFEITHNTCAVRVSLRDITGYSMVAEVANRTLEAGDTLNFADVAPGINEYILLYALLENGDTDPQVVSVTADDSGNLLFIGTDGTTYSAEKDTQVYLVYRPEKATLSYEMDSPAVNGWVSYDGDGNYAPSLAASTQEVTETVTNLYALSGKNGAGYFIANTLNNRSKEKAYFDNYNNNHGYTPGVAGYLPPGGEYEFLGWRAVNTSGQSCLFPENAAIYMDERGNLCVADVNGNVQKLESGTTLHGQWKLRSNAILFYVNHGDTMLEGEDNQPIGSTRSEYYTDIAAIGHIYNIDDPDAFARDRIEINTHDELQTILQPDFNPNSDQTQIVVDAVKLIDESDNASYVQATNYNQLLLEVSIAAYIRSQDGKTILLDNAELDKSMITPENYILYWYGLKMVSSDANCYHMDGVLVARTQTMEIYKTFSGLTREQADTLIGKMSFPLHLIHSETDTEGNVVEVKDDYTSLLASGSQQGVYTYNGPQSSVSNIYKWTLEAVLGQRYAFEEAGYALDGYDVSSLISVHYRDGTIEYRYETDATYEDVDTRTGIINGLFHDKPLIGGNVESIIFANFYTPEETGMFSISKVADDVGQVRLPGAVFTLMDENRNVLQTKTTNENGAVDFSGLAVGEYILVETAEPVGYQKADTEWRVFVTETDNGISVSIQEKGSAEAPVELFNSTQGIREVYLVKNEPEQTTVKINKYFVNITDTAVASLYDDDEDWADDYYIQVLDSTGAVVDILTLDKQTEELTKANLITGVMNGFSWTIDLLPNETYSFVEKNYLHEHYLDTVVNASVNDAVASITKTDTDGDSEPDTAAFTFHKSEAADTVSITNTYTNTFTLRIHKVDATNDNEGIDGVMFKIFGDFQLSSGSETLEYTDENGDVHTVYYVTTVTTRNGGYAEYDNMQLSSGSRSFLYVVDEVETPAGYIQLSEPIVKVIEVDSENYQNGVYTLTIENFEIEKIEELKAMVSVTASTQWNVPQSLNPESYPDIKVTLYRKGSNNSAEVLHTLTLTGENVAKTTIDGDFAYQITGWQVKWTGLPFADTGSNVRYEYYVTQEGVPGYNTRYSTYLERLNVNGTTVYAARAKDSSEVQLERQITLTQETGYALPESGGVGTGWHIFLGLSLMAACFWLYRRGLYKKKQEGGDVS